MQSSFILCLLCAILPIQAYAEFQENNAGVHTPAPLTRNYVSDLSNPAAFAAVLDGVSTQIALNTGAVEANPLFGSNPSPLSIVTFSAAKILATPLIRDLEAPMRQNTMGSITGLWSAAGVNNL